MSYFNLDYPLLIEEARERRYEAAKFSKMKEWFIWYKIEKELVEESIWLNLKK